MLRIKVHEPTSNAAGRHTAQSHCASRLRSRDFAPALQSIQCFAHDIVVCMITLRSSTAGVKS